MYEIIFSDTARKQLKKLSFELQERILHSLERIRIRPEAFVKRLVGISAYSFRVGDYRVILDIDNSKLFVLVLKVAHRKDVYDF